MEIFFSEVGAKCRKFSQILAEIADIRYVQSAFGIGNKILCLNLQILWKTCDHSSSLANFEENLRSQFFVTSN